MRYAIKNLEKVEKVFNKMKPFLPEAYRNIQLSIAFTEAKTYKTYQGAFAVKHVIHIGTEYLNKYNLTEISIAMVLGHELGHHVLGHLNNDCSTVPEEERDCDHFGMYLSELAGYKRANLIEHLRIFERDRARTLSSRHLKEHGAGSVRAEKLKKQDQYLVSLDW